MKNTSNMISKKEGLKSDQDAVLLSIINAFEKSIIPGKKFIEKTVPVFVLSIAYRDYMPRPEKEFDNWQKNFISKIDANKVAWNLATVDVNALKDFQVNDWNPKYAVGKDEADPNRKQRKEKNESHKLFEKKLRSFVQKFIRRNDAISPAALVSMKIPVIDSIRTSSSEPAVSPDGRIEHYKHLEHIIRISNPEDQESNQRPEGIKHTRVYRCIREKKEPAPGSIKEYELLCNATTFLVSSKFSETDIGKVAYYVLQYENTTGKTGLPGKSFGGIIP